MNTQTTQRFVSDTASTRDSARRGSTYRSSTQRFVSDNDDSPCRNSTLLDLPHRFATSFNATQRFVSYIAPLLRATSRASAPLTAPHRVSTQRFVSDNSALGNATLCAATQLNSTQRFVSDTAPLLSASYRFAPLRISPQLNVIA